MNFDMNFVDKGKKILKKAASNERMINYNNCFFKKSNLVIKKFNFLKSFDTFYDLLIYLLREEIRTLKVAKEQEEMKENKNKVRNLLLLKKESMKKNKTEGNIKKSKK